MTEPPHLPVWAQRVRAAHGPFAHALVALLALAAAAPRLLSEAFCLDDAYIHLSYVRSLHLGEGLSYNPGDFETGASSPLWVLVLACLGSATPPVGLVKLVGLACHVGTALVAMELAARSALPEARRTVSLTAGLLVAGTPWLVQGAVSGMEVSLTALLWIATATSCEPGVGSDSRASRPLLAATLGALSYAARPESLVFCGLVSGLLWLRDRRSRGQALAPLLGALMAACLWSAYLLAVSGYPLPNTYYVKAGDSPHWQSLRYLLIALPPWQPTLVSLVGPAAVLVALRGAGSGARRRLVELGVLCAGTLGAVALTRELAPETLFFHSRHLAPVMWVPGVMTALSLAYLRKRLMYAAAIALTLVTGGTLYLSDQVVAAQEQGVTHLHREVAAYVRDSLPPNAVLAVEGAGALRYFTPRSMPIVDLMGLNSGAIAHGPRSAAARLCYAATRGMTHIAYLGRWQQTIGTFVELETLRVFEEPRYAQTRPPQRYVVVVARVAGYRPDFPRPCAELARGMGWVQATVQATPGR